MTIRVVLQLLAIQIFMLAQSILRSSITLFVIRYWMVQLLWSIALMKTILLTSSPKTYLIVLLFLIPDLYELSPVLGSKRGC